MTGPSGDFVSRPDRHPHSALRSEKEATVTSRSEVARALRSFSFAKRMCERLRIYTINGGTSLVPRLGTSQKRQMARVARHRERSCQQHSALTLRACQEFCISSRARADGMSWMPALH